jgi:hypothetical protein
MKLKYKGRDFELMHLYDLNGEDFDIVAIYEEVYVYFLEGGQVKEVGFEEWKKAYDNDEDLPFQEMRFINYFWGADDDQEVIIENAKNFIDDYDKKEGKVAKLLRGLENHLISLKVPSDKGIAELLEDDEATQEYLFEILEALIRKDHQNEEE